MDTQALNPAVFAKCASLAFGRDESYARSILDGLTGVGLVVLCEDGLMRQSPLCQVMFPGLFPEMVRIAREARLAAPRSGLAAWRM